jgi:hypothetical protein
MMQHIDRAKAALIAAAHELQRGHAELDHLVDDHLRLFEQRDALLDALWELVTLCQEDPSFHDPVHEPDSYAALVHAEQAIALVTTVATENGPAKDAE